MEDMKLPGVELSDAECAWQCILHRQELAVELSRLLERIKRKQKKVMAQCQQEYADKGTISLKLAGRLRRLWGITEGLQASIMAEYGYRFEKVDGCIVQIREDS